MEDINNLLATKISAGLQELNLELNEAKVTQLINFIHLLIKWNKVYNLTAITNPDEIITHHVLDSLSIAPYLHGKQILDVGSGAGFPGIPLAITFPEKNFVLLDSNGKKTRFITQAIGELAIKNVTVIQSRVEDYQPALCFDVLLARAFSSLENIISLTQHLLCSSGEWLMMKGLYPQAELEKIVNRVKVYKLSVPGLNEQRHLVSIKGLPNE